MTRYRLALCRRHRLRSHLGGLCCRRWCGVRQRGHGRMHTRGLGPPAWLDGPRGGLDSARRVRVAPRRPQTHSSV